MFKYKPFKFLLILVPLAGGLAAAAGHEDFRFYAYPNPFQAGYASARLSYILLAEAIVSIYVYDLEGQRVRTLVERAERPRGSHNGQEVWDGRDDDGEFVPAGPYVVVLEVRVRGAPCEDTFIAVVKR
ncbi:MAG: hypothetical protein GTN49_01390 [candidate division Zixibacteria bacterium]|nr:hypothetical protein [candidate division Zixibacteria bacterium]